MSQVLLRQEHHDQSSRQTLCVQVWLPRADDRVSPESAADASGAVRPSSGRWPIIGRRAVCNAVTVRICWWPIRPAARFCFRPADHHISGWAVLLGYIRRGPFHAVPTSGRAVSTVIQLNTYLINIIIYNMYKGRIFELFEFSNTVNFDILVKFEVHWKSILEIKLYFKLETFRTSNSSRKNKSNINTVINIPNQYITKYK